MGGESAEQSQNNLKALSDNLDTEPSCIEHENVSEESKSIEIVK